jgi:transcription initiation factor TFIIIB Brf1 subunit/transcription initiation factor TFIIB
MNNILISPHYRQLLSRILEDSKNPCHKIHLKNYMIYSETPKDSDEELDEEMIDMTYEMNKIKDDFYDVSSEDEEEYIAVYLEEAKKILSKDDCIYCKTKNSLKIIIGESVKQCMECGRDNKKLFDETAEWRTFESTTENLARCSGLADNYLQDSATGSTIATKGYNRMKQINNWVAMTPKQRSKMSIINRIKGCCTKGEFKKCTINDVISIFLELTSGTIEYDSSVIRGLNKITIASAIATYCCKKNGEPRTPEEIVEIFQINIDDLTNAIRSFEELCQLKGKSYVIKNSQPEEFLLRLAPKLKVVTMQNIEIAMRIAINTKKINICAKHTPTSIAAASVMLMSCLKELNLKSATVSEVFRITVSTCDKVLEKLKKYAKIITNDEATEKVVAIIERKKKEQFALI